MRDLSISRKTYRYAVCGILVVYLLKSVKINIGAPCSVAGGNAVRLNFLFANNSKNRIFIIITKLRQKKIKIAKKNNL